MTLEGGTMIERVFEATSSLCYCLLPSTTMDQQQQQCCVVVVVVEPCHYNCVLNHVMVWDSCTNT